MGNVFNDFQNKAFRWEDNLSSSPQDAIEMPNDPGFTAWGGIELDEAPDILRKSIERFLIGNVI